MNRVILVDDDPIVLIQLRKMIEWEKLNCELVAEAANGEDAIWAIEQYDPQIVITDISMPGMTGVELIQHVSKRKNRTKVIAISAFDHFNYVRESLKNGAGDYLLKHQLTAEILESAISSALSELGQEEGKAEQLSVQEQKERLIYRLIHAGIREKDIQKLQELSLGWIKEKMVLALISIENESVTDENTAYVFMDETIKYYRDYQIVLFAPNVYLIMFSADDERKEEIPVVIEQIRMNLKRFCDVEACYGISEIIHGFQDVGSVISQCKEQIQNKKETAGYSDTVCQAITYIKEHYKEKISLTDIAEALNFSISHLSRCFKKETGESVVSYINRIRMEQAKKLMKEGKLSLNEISLEIGVLNYNYFYTMFKETFGISPSDYTKKLDKQ